MSVSLCTQVTIHTRDIWSTYEIWRASRAITMNDDDPDNDLQDPSERITLMVNLEKDREGEFFEATLVRQQTADGTIGPAAGDARRMFRVLRKPRTVDGTISSDRRGNGTGEHAGTALGDDLSASGAGRSTGGRFGRLAGNWLFRTPRQETQALFADAQIDIWTIECVVACSCRAALLVHINRTALINTVPTLLCSLLGCLMAIEAYIKSPSFLGQKGAAAELQGHQLVRPHPKALAFVIERAIYNLVTNYYEHMESFAFPPEYGPRLQQFLDFRA